MILNMLFCLLPCSIIAEVVTVNWKIGYVDNINPDGRFPRTVIGVNDQWPIPAIHVTLQDTLVVNVENTLDVATSLHTHGLYHVNATHMDGSYGVTQCGIPAGGKFVYTISINQTGTYWIHGHIGGQYVDGLRAPLILHAPNEKIDLSYSAEYIVGLSDWYHESHRKLLDHYLSIFNPSGAEPVPQAPLLNEIQNEKFNFIPGTTYRIRFISMTALAMYYVWIDDHKMRVIEVDGIDVEPYEVDALPIASAQRYSVLVTAKNTTDFNYYMNAKFNMEMFDDPSLILQPLVQAQLIYKADSPVFVPQDGYEPDPTTFDETLLVPKIVIAAANSDISLDYNVNFGLYADGVNHGTFNHIVYSMPIVPSLFTAISMGNLSSTNDVYGPASQAKVLDHMQMVQLVINNYDAGVQLTIGNHPFHLHGHAFAILTKGRDGPYTPTPDSIAQMVSQKNPIRRDTLVVPGGGHAVIQFQANNPGVWLFHCHIEWHLQAGLASLFVEAPLLLQKSLSIPDYFKDQCTAQGIKSSGNAAGFMDTTTFTGLSTPPGVYPISMNAQGVVALVGCVISALSGLGAVIWFSHSTANISNKL